MYKLQNPVWKNNNIIELSLESTALLTDTAIFVSCFYNNFKKTLIHAEKVIIYTVHVQQDKINCHT